MNLVSDELLYLCKSVFVAQTNAYTGDICFLRQASREIAEQQRKAREEAENKRIEQIMSKVSGNLSDP